MLSWAAPNSKDLSHPIPFTMTAPYHICVNSGRADILVALHIAALAPDGNRVCGPPGLRATDFRMPQLQTLKLPSGRPSRVLHGVWLRGLWGPMKSSVTKRNIVIDGHKTSVSLEDAFWNALKEIAYAKQTTLSELVAHIDSARK